MNTASSVSRILPLSLALLLATALVAVGTAQQTPIEIQEGQEPFAMSVVADGLAFPWEVTWGPDDHLWVTEREGARVTRIDPSDGSTSVALTIDDEVHVGPQHEGLLGMALHPELLQGTGNDYVYVAYTYNVGGEHELDRRAKIRRYTYDPETETLGEPQDLLTDLDAWNDHNAGRLVWGPDDMLYYSTGEQGGNQLSNFLRPINAQRLPTAPQVSPTAYEGKILRIEPDGGIPADNPELDGVVTHVYSYGHRNPQGLTFGPDGTLYVAEHGPRVDDELNIIEAGANYGWPHVAGYQDDQAYEYANWSEIEDPPEDLRHDPDNVPEGVPIEQESDFEEEFREPIATYWTVEDDYDFTSGCGFVCWPTIAPSSVAYYDAGENGIEAWDGSLLITTLKHGAIYRQPLSEDGQAAAGDPIRYFNTQNRYRDLAISPDGTTIYVATDNAGSTAELGGTGATSALEHPGAILAFRYLGEDAGASDADFPAGVPTPVSPGGAEVSLDGEVVAPATPEADEEAESADAGAEEAAPAEDDAGPANGDAAAGADLEALVAEGEAIYGVNCATCHGQEGGGGAGPALEGNDSLADAAHVLDVIHNGRGFMPAFGDQLSDREIAAVASYVRNAWGNEFGPVTEAQSEEAR